MSSTSPTQDTAAMMAISPAQRIRFTSVQMVPRMGGDCRQACGGSSDIEVLGSLQIAQEIAMRPAHPVIVFHFANKVSPTSSTSNTGNDGRRAPEPLLGCWGITGSAMVDRAWRKGVAKAHGLSFLLERCEDHLVVYPARNFYEAAREWVAEISE